MPGPESIPLPLLGEQLKTLHESIPLPPLGEGRTIEDFVAALQERPRTSDVVELLHLQRGTA